MHYNRRWRHGSLEQLKPSPAEYRAMAEANLAPDFWDQVDAHFRERFGCEPRT